MSEKKFSILSPKDILILKQLLEDGRKSSSSISKEIDLGREIVNYRIKRLIKENLIVKFVPKINEEALNYKEYLILLKLNLEDDISKEQFIKQTIGNKYLIWTVKSDAGWDLIVRLYAQNIDEFKNKLQEILSKCSDVLARYYTIISSDEIKESEKEILAEKIFNEEPENKDFKVVKKSELIQLDDKNKEILRLLQTDARVQYKEIAEKLDISSDTVKYRIDKMIEQGAISSFSPVLNYNKLDLIQYAGIIKFDYLDQNNEQKVNDYLVKNKCVMKAIKNLNRDEYFLTIVCSNQEEIDKFKSQLENKFLNKIHSFELFSID